MQRPDALYPVFSWSERLNPPGPPAIFQFMIIYTHSPRFTLKAQSHTQMEVSTSI